MCEMPTAYRMVVRVARNPHRCCECRGVIPAGESYNYHSGVWDGRPAAFKVCVDCDALRDRIEKECDLHMDEFPAFGELRDCAEEYHQEQFIAIQNKRRQLGEKGSAA